MFMFMVSGHFACIPFKSVCFSVFGTFKETFYTRLKSWFLHSCFLAQGRILKALIFVSNFFFLFVGNQLIS